MRILLISVLFLAACGDTFNTPIKPEYRRDTVQVTWHEVDSEAKLYAICGEPEKGKKILACAKIGINAPCTIYTHRNPTLEEMGHEALHCFLGRWHG